MRSSMLSLALALVASGNALAMDDMAGMDMSSGDTGKSAAPASPSTHDHSPTPALPSTPGSGTPTGAGMSEHMGHEGGGDFWWWKVDQLESVRTADESAARWKAGVSWGGSFDRLWLTSDGDTTDGKRGDVATQLYWTHAVSAFWDATLVGRVDNGPGRAQSWAGIGLQGLAPYWLETAVTVLAGEGGQSSVRMDVDYDILLTNRLILKPGIGLDFYGRDDASRQQGAGLAESGAALRLRYEVTRKFAPYVGVEWRNRYGRTADLIQAAGERTHDAEAVAGVRLWY
ncbi:MAG TPA: copper resistance protein B [Moraxellaceae bacterium]|nr:copper resistance protein B [Moraxellaceae bacterium]